MAMALIVPRLSAGPPHWPPQALILAHSSTSVSWRALTPSTDPSA
eukprot:CAMPEP_0185774802 /NCGR_PEP_ID=MMETSP1174-20130828/79909_1 /TAXON_ID=35687 /ORGANISM="Dictyocha speculum, Strain CCMP1381" /LENGTH=44 /DNA_ID= /DNA_START= /DNA_END= /DNA_ORIENTATION=